MDLLPILATIVLVLLLTARWRVQPFLALLVGAVLFGELAGMATNYLARAFTTGFSQTIASPGLIVVGAALMAEIAAGTGALAWIADRTRGSRFDLLSLPIGIVAGGASSPGAAFAALMPLARGLGQSGAPRPLLLALTLSAAHAVLLPSPVMLGAVTILGANWVETALFSIPVLIVSVAVGWLHTRAFGAYGIVPPHPPAELEDEIDGAVQLEKTPVRARRSAWALAVASAVLIGLLVVQAMGDIASEPFGGGPQREYIIGFGRPLTVLVAGVALVFLFSWPWKIADFGEQGWPGRALSRVAGLLLLVGCAGGLQRMTQETGLAEMTAERLLGFDGGLAVPFLVAATLKFMHGNSLVAAIGAAGIVQPFMGSLGLDEPTARVLASLAVGCGALTGSHVNDPLFWLVGDAAGLRAAPAFLRFTLGTVLQGVVSLGVILLLGVVLV